MKKFLALTVAFAMMATMVLSFLPSSEVQAASGDGKFVRRALVIGNTTYAQSALVAPEYDASHMEQLFKQQNFGGTTGSAGEQAGLASIVKKTNQTRTQILQDIAAAFAGADADDISYFYYSGHGSVDNGEAQLVGVDMSDLSLTALKAALDKVPGKKVILLDSCFSGGFINKASTTTSTSKKATDKVSAFLSDRNKTTKAVDTKAGLKKLKDSSFSELFPYVLKSQPPAEGKSTTEIFGSSVEGTFAKAPKYLNNSSYIVITASSMVEYSYEVPFSKLYGSSFYMNGLDLTDHGYAYSGEFTGMLITGAGKVTLSPTYGEDDLLADYNGDKKLTVSELEHYLKGAVLFSDVRVYPSAAESSAANTFAVFSYTSGAANPRVKLTNGIDDITTTGNIPITLDLTGISADVTKKLIVYKFPKTSDGLCVNGFIDQLAIRTLNITNHANVSWDGKDEKGNAVADGTYKIILECGEGAVTEDDPPTIYPGVTVVLARGISEFNSSNKITGFTSSGSSYTYSGSVAIAADGDEDSVWFTAPASGAMNVYVDISTLSNKKNLQAQCLLYDSEGNIVNYSLSSAKTYKLFLPFAVEANKSYRLKFGFNNDPDIKGDYGSYSFSLKLNKTISVNSQVNAPGANFEAWLIQPATVEAGNYVLQSASTGHADTIAELIDSNQTSLLAMGDDFNDENFLMKTPLLADHGYLLVVAEYQSQTDATKAVAYSFKVNSPSQSPQFSYGSYPKVDSASPVIVANSNGYTTYQVLETGSTRAKWTFNANKNGTASLSKNNDPSILLMDKDYNLIGSSDDYNNQYDSAFSVLLQANKTYILACRSAGSAPYNYAVTVTKNTMTSTKQIVTTPKVVYLDNSALSLDRYGNVSGWGYNMFGELGLGNVEPTPAPTVVIFPGNSQAVDLWAGGMTGFARLKNGSYCYWGVLLFDDTGSLIPRVLHSLQGLDIASISCGEFTSVALVRTYTGELYQLNIQMDTIEKVALPGAASHSVKQVATTEDSYFALTYAGKLYSWEDTMDDEGNLQPETPELVSFGSTTINQIATGWEHILALTSTGSIYAWGSNDDGQLGQNVASLNEYNFASKPMKITKGDIAGKVIKSVYAGASESLCVDADGNVYGWGDNSYGQLGLGNASKALAAKQITFYGNGAGKVPVMSMGAGMFAVFAQDFNLNLYGYGANLDYQLGRTGQAPDDGIIKLMTLWGTPVGHSTKLSSLQPLHVDNGTVSISGNTITVQIGENSGSCYIVPQPEVQGATYKIGTESVTGKTILVPNPGSSSAAVTVTVSDTFGTTPTDYTVIVSRDKSTNTDLKSLTLSTGAILSPNFSKKTHSYTIIVPEVFSSVKVTPVSDGYQSHYAIDTAAQDTPQTFTPTLGGSLVSTITVTSQSGSKSVYNLTIKRPLTLTTLAAAPVYSGYPSLSPGGTNRMKISYSLSLPAAVKIEVLKGSTWYTLTTITEKIAGLKNWLWDGKANGAYLSAGTYTIRVTPTYNGKACTAKLLTVKVLSKPYVTIKSVTPYKFTVNGTNKLIVTVKWTALSDVKVEIINSVNKVVNTLFSAADQAPATRSLYWTGKLAGGSLAPAGTYRVKVTIGGATVLYKSFIVKR
jgi:alpha-tubulin suppressor-like RCC1 family protein/flagellar hook assembly protein FlgD